MRFVASGTIIVRFDYPAHGIANGFRCDQVASHSPVCKRLGGLVRPFDGGTVIGFEQTGGGPAERL
jgi:hypothetical protein